MWSGKNGLSYWVVFSEAPLAALFTWKKAPPPADRQPNSHPQLNSPCVWMQMTGYLRTNNLLKAGKPC